MSRPSDPPPTFPSLAERVIVLTGPTASGKSGVGIELAERIGGEILSLDSIAVYQGMDIGTAKPTKEDQARVVHHLIDVVSPTEDYSVARYLAVAHLLVDELETAGKPAIFVGGTPMFLKGILRGFDPGPPADWEFRDAVERDLQKHGHEALHRRLVQVDPLAAHKIDPTDTRRITRALEVTRSTGVPMSHHQTQFQQSRPAEACRVFALQWERSKLHDRINQRVERMFDDGLVDEVRQLIATFGQLSRTAAQAVGYRELIDMATNHSAGDESPEAAKAMVTAKTLIATHTRQLAKRQETWIRSFSEVTPIEMTDEQTAASVADQIAQRIDGYGDSTPI